MLEHAGQLVQGHAYLVLLLLVGHLDCQAVVGQLQFLELLQVLGVAGLEQGPYFLDVGLKGLELHLAEHLHVGFLPVTGGVNCVDHQDVDAGAADYVLVILGHLDDEFDGGPDPLVLFGHQLLGYLSLLHSIDGA